MSAFETRSVWELSEDDQVTGILSRNETCGHDLEAAPRQREQAGIHGQRDAWDAFTTGIKEVKLGWSDKKSEDRKAKRAEMWGTMKDWLKTASIPSDRQLKADLVGPMKKPNSSGTIFLEGKKEMRSRGLASPDAADALAVTFAFPVAHREYREPVRRVNSQSNAVTNSWMGS